MSRLRTPLLTTVAAIVALGPVASLAGQAVSSDGRVILVLEDGRILCLGRRQVEI